MNQTKTLGDKLSHKGYKRQKLVIYIVGMDVTLI
jgi:hypothetical protein